VTTASIARSPAKVRRHVLGGADAKNTERPVTTGDLTSRTRVAEDVAAGDGATTAGAAISRSQRALASILLETGETVEVAVTLRIAGPDTVRGSCGTHGAIRGRAPVRGVLRHADATADLVCRRAVHAARGAAGRAGVSSGTALAGSTPSAGRTARADRACRTGSAGAAAHGAGCCIDARIGRCRAALSSSRRGPAATGRGHASPGARRGSTAGRSAARLGTRRASVLGAGRGTRVGPSVADRHEGTRLLIDLLSCGAASQHRGECWYPVPGPRKHRAERRPRGRTVQGTHGKSAKIKVFRQLHSAEGALRKGSERAAQLRATANSCAQMTRSVAGSGHAAHGGLNERPGPVGMWHELPRYKVSR
jgi:hypothetical protein